MSLCHYISLLAMVHPYSSYDPKFPSHQNLLQLAKHAVAETVEHMDTKTQRVVTMNLTGSHRQVGQQLWPENIRQVGFTALMIPDAKLMPSCSCTANRSSFREKISMARCVRQLPALVCIFCTTLEQKWAKSTQCRTFMNIPSVNGMRIVLPSGPSVLPYYDSDMPSDTDMYSSQSTFKCCVTYPIGSMVLLYMVTWIPSIYPLYVSIYTSTMDPSWVLINMPLHQLKASKGWPWRSATRWSER